MNRTDPDLVAVRNLPPGLSEPDDEAVARTWRAVVSGHAARQRRSWRPRLVLPVTAAAVVAGLALGAGLVLAPPNGAGPDRPATPPGQADPLAVSYGGPAVVRAALDELIARAATVEPVPVPDGRFIYVRTRTVAVPGAGGPAAGSSGEPGPPVAGTASGTPTGGPGATPGSGNAAPNSPHEPLPIDHQMWLTPRGMIVLDARLNGQDVDPGPTDGQRGSEAMQRLLVEGPSLGLPTPQWLAELPTDPALLRSRLLDDLAGSPDSPDGRLAKALGVLLRSADPVLVPAVRVALYQVLAGLDGLSAARVTVGGREQYVIRHVDGGAVTDLLLDPGTGRAAGRATGRLAGTGGGGSDAAAYPAGLRSQDLWSWAIVPTVGRIG
ncbi:hypothetical protein [Plantactinospora soyae]|uniref:CU044_5270 family protein n=1 Tax=Plantactinospora soyae TaxID=1544732 RepID=A0A927M5P7_9ACTN|nr:hypothetical protein [Plantactinospora soyae]MBE1488469.1 hypothetical protein [Plantactinospora soyae]